MKMTGADIVIETLIEQGCDTVFGYPGGSVLNIYDSLYLNEERIKHIITAHEQGASHAADGYARATGKVGVVIATSGPGATNLVTGIATAHLDSTPLVAITGNVSVNLIGRDSFQEVDIMGITMPITKHNYIVKDIADLADTIREAFKIAKSGRPGPVLIDIPKDVQVGTADFQPKETVKPDEAFYATDKEIEDAIKIIKESKRPYIYCGGGVVINEAGEGVMALAEKIDAPIGCSMMGLSAIPRNFKYALGMQGMHGNYAATKAQSEADLVIALGVRFSDRATGNKVKYAENAKIIHIDIDPAEIDKNIYVYQGIISDINNAVTKLVEEIEPMKHDNWMKDVESYVHEMDSVDVNPENIRPFSIIDAVEAHMADDEIIATDVGQHQMWTAQHYPFKQPRTFITSGGLGTMGFGLGAAIGACMGSGKRTVLFTGDGSFGMNLNELATVASNDLPLVIVILNNGVLGMVRQWQTLFYKKHYSSTTLNRQTDFVKLAEAFGVKGYQADNMEEVRAALDEAFASSSPAVINCIIDKDEMVLPMIPAGGAIDQIIVRKKEIGGI